MTSTLPTTTDIFDFTAATLVRPGDAATVARLQYLGGRVLHRGEHTDGESGATHPAVLVRIGRQRVLVVLTAGDTSTPATLTTHGQRDPPRRAA